MRRIPFDTNGSGNSMAQGSEIWRTCPLCSKDYQEADFEDPGICPDCEALKDIEKDLEEKYREFMENPMETEILLAQIEKERISLLYRI